MRVENKSAAEGKEYISSVYQSDASNVKKLKRIQICSKAGRISPKIQLGEY